MPIPLYLAMTAAEISQNTQLPDKIGWMACHFSPYGTGLSNCPQWLPPGSLLILNDRTPICGHDPEIVAEQLCSIAANLACAGILLDLQRPCCEAAAAVVQAICASTPCPVAATVPYCCESGCGVFLTPPLHIPLAEYLAPWQGREIWLEAAVEETEFVITENGCRQGPLPCPPAVFPHQSSEAFSNYHIAVEKDAVRFSLRRTREDVERMISAAENVRCFVGLYQQFR